MNQGLEELFQKRSAWVKSSQDNNFEEGIKRLLTELYPYNAHFIYELLQNAEDTKATHVAFTLESDRLIFEHNGKRLFNLNDVDSITSIGVSTKRDDPTSIGKFGVGFKAVFAYTNTPEIHSGSYHFTINDLVVPAPVDKVVFANGGTRFIFPFNHEKKPAHLAVSEIVTGLDALGDNTLLFLKNIQVIEYKILFKSKGTIERVENEYGHIKIHTTHPNGNKSVSHWLRCQREVEVLDDDDRPKKCRVAIAYSLEMGDDKKDTIPWKVTPLKRGQVSIYFPAEKETSNLWFHLHAPFASTVARDSVRDCVANIQLRNHIANLVVESLFDIRDRGMLSMGFLAVLPNPMDNLLPFYEPIREAIVLAFKNTALTPTRNGAHAPATKLYRGPKNISVVLSDDDLSLLTNDEPPLWAANPPPQSPREESFLDSLMIDSWGWSELACALSSIDDEERDPIENWIAQKDDAWLLRFYALLGEAYDRHDEYIDAEGFRIVRVEAGQGHDHVLPREAFFQPDQEISPPRNIRFVKPTVYSAGRFEEQKKFAVSFLKHNGVRTFDEKVVIEQKLKNCSNQHRQLTDDYYNDLKQFIAYWKKNPDDAAIFQNTCFLIGISANENLNFYKSSQLCLDSPYEETGLSTLSSIHGKYAVFNGYKKNLNESQFTDFISFLKFIGVMYKIEVTRQSTHNRRGHCEKLHQDCNGKTRKRNPVDDDYSIPYLASYLAFRTVYSSRLIWDALIRSKSAVRQALYAPNGRFKPRVDDSWLVIQLRKHEWIPDRSGKFHKPADMTKEDLHTDFPYDDHNGLLTAIGFGEHAKKRGEEYLARNEKAKDLGFCSAEEAAELAKLVSETGITPEELRSLVSQRQHASQPEDSVANPERRKKSVVERRGNAPNKESITRERSIQPGAKYEILEARAYLRTKYKNQDGQLVCQCCHREMPFKVRDEHYFEAIQCVRGLDQHHFENRLALCPTCAAMYRHAREIDDTEIRRRIIEHTAADTVPSVEIPISLAGKSYVLRFVGTHWFDLKTILGKTGD